MHTLLPHASLHGYDDGRLGLLTSADELGPIVSRFLTSDGADGSPGDPLDRWRAQRVG